MPVNYKQIKICKHCQVSFDTLDKPKGWMANHVRWCHQNPARKAYLEQKNAALNKPKSRRSLSEKTKKIISEKRKVWLAENPNKHPWRSSTKFKSKPCERLKETLTSLGISFVEEYSPIANRGFAIDIAFPDIRLGIEVNGNQHYNPDGTLKEYYQDRHDIIESNGWALLEIHYTDCFVPQRILKILAERKQPDYSESFGKRQKTREKHDKISLGRPKKGTPRPQTRVYDRPSPQDLHKLIWSKSIQAISKEIGCSDNTVKKWCKSYQIPNPSRGFWAKIYSNKLEGQTCPLFVPVSTA